jgi:hypothetical protein
MNQQLIMFKLKIMNRNKMELSKAKGLTNKISITLIAIMIGFGMNLIAQPESSLSQVTPKNSQEQDQDQPDDLPPTKVQEESTIVRPVHISFITPISTNGMQSGEVTNIFSLNMIAGYSGGLQGFEVAGFSNVIKGETKGVQLAGFSNTNMGNVDGIQAAGFSNVALGEVNGFQGAGFANVARKDIRAVQIAGFSNTSGTMHLGGQFAGFSNVCIGSANGIQVAGFMNVVKDSIYAMQAAGFANVAGGMPVGGQVAGFANVNRGDANGIQVAGFSNVNTGDIKGAQVSGFLNVAKKVDGLQIAPFNFADSVDNGISIGVFSFIKHGYRTLEIGANETFYANLSFKTGTERFYNVISLGAAAKNNEINWGWGYGLGTMMPVSKKMKLNIEAVSYHVNEDVWFTSRLNSLNKLNVAVEYKISDFLTVYGGPTLNVHVSHVYYVEGEETTSSLVGWNVFDRTRNNTNVKMYPGFTIGIRL